MSRPTLAYSAAEHRRRLEQASDRDLLAALKEDDEMALDELIERKTAPLVTTVSRILDDREEARDVVQTAFLRIWENRQSYDPRYSPNTWIYRIATNLGIDVLRSRQSRARQEEPYRHHLRQISGGDSPRGLAQLKEREIAQIFEELAADLSEKQRLAFVLRELEGLSTIEVAEILECRASTVRNHVFHARKALQDEVVRRYPEYCRRQAADEGVESS